MRIRALEFDGLRGLPSQRWEFPALESGADVVAVTGKRGSGKTTFLDAIAAAKEKISAYGLPDQRWQWLVPLGQAASRVSMMLQVTPKERERHHLDSDLLECEAILGEPLVARPKPSRALTTLLGTWSKDQEVGRVAYFHHNRDLPPPSPDVMPSHSNWLIRLAGDTQKYARLVGLIAERRPELERANALLSSVTGLRIEGLEPSRGRTDIRLRRDAGGSVLAANLSTSERQLTLFALAFADAGFHESLVLIDTPELGFGDEGAAELVGILQSWGTGNQFIVATTSRSLVSALPPQRVVVLS